MVPIVAPRPRYSIVVPFGFAANNSQFYIFNNNSEIKYTYNTMAADKTIDDYDFAGADAGASHIYNEEAGQIRVGG